MRRPANSRPAKAIRAELVSRSTVHQGHNLFGIWRLSLIRKALPGFFLCIFSSLTCLKKPVFSKRGLLLLKVPARLYWELLTSGR
jgi:hypothetical protein